MVRERAIERLGEKRRDEKSNTVFISSISYLFISVF